MGNEYTSVGINDAPGECQRLGAGKKYDLKTDFRLHFPQIGWQAALLKGMDMTVSCLDQDTPLDVPKWHADVRVEIDFSFFGLTIENGVVLVRLNAPVDGNEARTGSGKTIWEPSSVIGWVAADTLKMSVGSSFLGGGSPETSPSTEEELPSSLGGGQLLSALGEEETGAAETDGDEKDLSMFSLSITDLNVTFDSSPAITSARFRISSKFQLPMDSENPFFNMTMQTGLVTYPLRTNLRFDGELYMNLPSSGENGFGIDLGTFVAFVEIFTDPNMDPSIRRGRVMVARAWQLPGERRAHFKGMQVLNARIYFAAYEPVDGAPIDPNPANGDGLLRYRWEGEVRGDVILDIGADVPSDGGNGLNIQADTFVKLTFDKPARKLPEEVRETGGRRRRSRSRRRRISSRFSLFFLCACFIIFILRCLFLFAVSPGAAAGRGVNAKTHNN